MSVCPKKTPDPLPTPFARLSPRTHRLVLKKWQDYDLRPAKFRRKAIPTMPYRLLRFALKKRYPEPRMFREPERLDDSYDVVIIGGGGHGLGAAYYLARDYGITKIAVLEKGYIGGGNTGRNTAIVRSNYLTVEGVK